MNYFNNGNSFGMPPFNPFSSDNWYIQDFNVGNNYVSPSYGYAYDEPKREYVPPVPDVTVTQESYKYDALSDSWGKEIANNKGKVNVTPLTGGFNLTGIFKNKAPDGDLRFVVIQYMTKGKSYTVLMPKDDFIREKFHQYLREIYRYPNCTKRQFNDLISFLLQTVFSQDILMYPHQGFQESADGTTVFASDPPHFFFPHALISPSVARRKVYDTERAKQDVIDCWKTFFSKNPSLMFMGYYRIGSLFQFFLRQAGLSVKQFLIAEPSQGMDKDKLTATLATNDTVNSPIPTLGAGEDVIMAEQEYVYDGVAVYTDDCFADEEKEMLAGLKSIIRIVKGEVTNPELGNGLTAVISKNAAYAATRLAPENVIVVNTDGIVVEEEEDTIRNITGEMDSLVIKTIMSHAAELKEFISSYVPKLRTDLSKETDNVSLDTLAMVVFVECFFRIYLEFSMMDDDTMKEFIKAVDCKSDRVMDACEAIEHDFYSILSRMARAKSIAPVLKRRGKAFDNDGKAFLVDGNRLYIPADIIEAILAQMTTTHSLESLMRALKQTQALEATDGNTHPIEVHNSAGEHQRLYFYDVSAEFLDADVLYRLHNLASEAFLLGESEIPQNDFLALLRDAEGRVAGRQICYTDEENGHSYITGQSGWGKTYLLCQLLAKCFKLGHRVVVFDSSDSFTYEALCRNLSKRFVDSYVTIHDLEKDGIPVDLFGIDRVASLPTQKRQLLGILQAGIGELSAPQSNALRILLSYVISTLGDGERIRCRSLLDKLRAGSEDNEGRTYESLLNRVEPLFEDIEECGMADSSWGEFLRSSNNIVVIRTNSAYTESGNQLIDMLLATLYNHQHDNPQVALDVFIDELQNQNFSTTSPIRKVMKEGRKIHLSFFGATQDYYARNTELGSVMGKAGTQLFLRPTPNSANVVAAELRFSKAEMERFDSMMRGDIIAKANLFNKELGRNVPTTLSGHVDDYPKIPDNYYGNVL